MLVVIFWLVEVPRRFDRARATKKSISNPTKKMLTKGVAFASAVSRAAKPRYRAT